jgi:hypothetical protein
MLCLQSGQRHRHLAVHQVRQACMLLAFLHCGACCKPTKPTWAVFIVFIKLQAKSGEQQHWLLAKSSVCTRVYVRVCTCVLTRVYSRVCTHVWPLAPRSRVVTRSCSQVITRGTKKSSYSGKDGAWPEVSREDMQHVQLHPLFWTEAAQALELRQEKRVPRCEAARTCRPLPACSRLRGSFAAPCGVIPVVHALCAVAGSSPAPTTSLQSAFCKESSPGKVTGIVAALAHVASLRRP